MAFAAKKASKACQKETSQTILVSFASVFVMKKIGLISDTHGFLPERVFELFKDVDEIWHAGDIGDLNVTDSLEKFKPLRAVYGNIDDHTCRLTHPEFQSFELEGIRVLMTHIGGKPGKYNQKLYAAIQQEKPNLVVCGHSHILLVQFDRRINALWLNPGACGNKGFHQIQTALRFNLSQGKVEQMEIIEFGKRSQLHNSETF
jgi:putative phosphoesterase